ncbi:Two component system histidine kinase [Granulibacter bethesdensis]|nr:Two component system histidine kinase [Granulibacter bethesdensis]
MRRPGGGWRTEMQDETAIRRPLWRSILLPRPFTALKHSIKARLIVLPLVILAAAILFVIGVVLFDSNQRIEQEIQSGTELGDMLIHYALRSLGHSGDQDAEIEHLISDLSNIRHVIFIYVPSGTTPPHAAPPLVESGAPAWFAGWFHVPRPVRSFPVQIEGVFRGDIVMVGDPHNEIAEIWEELKFLLGLLACVSLMIMAAMFWTARYALRPISTLAEGLQRMRAGQFDALPPLYVTELKPIGERFNQLAETLRAVRGDNERLLEQMVSLQETERRELARELHDDFGATLFGARAELATLLLEARRQGDAGQLIIERAHAVARLIDQIQQQNGRILERLRPMALDHMGIADAIRDLMTQWQDRYPEMEWWLSMPRDLRIENDQINLVLYRTVQECLTNAVRHSSAERVDVTLSWHDGASGHGSARRLQLLVKDDGTGLPEHFRMGFGLLGMTERLRQCGGELKVRNNHPHGTLVEAVMPVAAVQKETAE